MEKGFRDIEEFFLQAEKEMRQTLPKAQKRKRVQRVESREELLLKVKSLSEKLKGKDRKIKELIREVVELREELDGYRKREEELKRREEELKEIEDFKDKIKVLKEEVARLKGEIKEKETQIESLKAREVPKPKVELFIEVALNSLSEFTAGKKRLKVLFSKRFRKDVVKEVSVRPFLLNGFISALDRIETTSKLLKRDSKYDIYRLRITSPYGEYRAVYLKLEDDVIKFVRFGQRDSIYQELDASNWSFS